MRAFLVLETGEAYSGVWHGGQPRAGEVVFNTSHSGYEEIATDPSYYSQIVVMTAPMQGNYGADNSVWESDRIWIEGFICMQIQSSVREISWKKRLLENGVPLVSDLDTRQLVLRLRSGGTPWGALVQAKDENEAKEQAKILIQEKKKIEKDWVYIASRKQIEQRRGQNLVGPKVAVIDYGCKENILRQLEKYCSELIIFPSRASKSEIMKYKPDGIMLTNGPGDPKDVQVTTEVVRSLVGELPIFGICMGHQILSLALGADTYKLKFGHRGSNHPIQDSLLKRIYVSSQNHGYAVKKETLPLDVEITQVNLNDNTVAGIYSQKRKFLGIQYHPESCPGPHEAQDLFKYFIEKMF